jgi:hypothetical protein
MFLNRICKNIVKFFNVLNFLFKNIRFGIILEKKKFFKLYYVIIHNFLKKLKRDIIYS